MFKRIVKNKDINNDNDDRRVGFKGIDRDRDIDRSKYDEGKGVSEGLHTKLLLDAFRQTTPVKAHCVSRALQLLSEAGLQSQFPKEVYSSICKTKFLSDNHSLPPGGEKITKEYGIYALAQLFYDTLQGTSPSISDSTREQYNTFLIKMKFMFEESKDTSTKQQLLSDVKNKLPSSICGDDAKDKTFKITNRDLIRKLRIHASNMINYQITHTANVTNILRKLFLLPIDSGKPLQLHPNVKKGGMEAINLIAAEARNVLINYYSQCEGMYRQGVEILGENKTLLQKI